MASDNNFYFNAISENKRNLRDIRNKDLSQNYYVKMTLNRTNRMFRWKGLPKTIPSDVFMSQVQTNGYTFIMPHNGDYYSYYGGFGGYPDVYYRPTLYNISNPYQELSGSFKIDYDKSGDGDGILVRNDYLCVGLLPLISRYSAMLVESDISMLVASINQRLISIMTATDNKTKESWEGFIKKIIAGDLSAIVQDGKTMMDDSHFKTNPYASTGSSNAITQLIENHHYIFANMWRELGVNENYNNKRETITSSESELSEAFTMTLIDSMLECQKQAAEELNYKFGWDCSVSFNPDSVWGINDRERKIILDMNTGTPDEEKEEKEEKEEVDENE